MEPSIHGANDQQSNPTKPVLVIGATGQTGVHVIPLLKAKAIPVRVMARSINKAQAMFGKEGVEYVEGDLTKKETLHKAVQNIDGVICTSGPTDTFFGQNTVHNVDYLGMKHLIEVLKEEKVENLRKIVFLSSSGVQSGWRHVALNLSLGNYAKWKCAAENELRKSGYDYVCARPGALNNGEAKRKLRLSQGDTVGWGSIARADVAWVCVEAYLSRSLQRATFEFVNGEDANLTSLFASVKSDSK